MLSRSCPVPTKTLKTIDVSNRSRRKLLAIKQNNFSLATADVDYTAAPTQKETDLTSRLWETEGTDPTIATLRKRLIDRNAPAAMWGAIGEDDIAKMDELRRYGSEITQGYLATVGEDEKHALKALVGTTLSKAEQAVSAAKLGVEEAKNMGGVSERKRAEEDLKSLEKERDALLQAKAGAEASDHEGIKVGISTATVDDKCNVNITLKDDMPLATLMSVKVEGFEYMQINGDVSITHVQNKRAATYTCNEAQVTKPGKYSGGYVSIPTAENAKKVFGALLEDPLTQSEKGDSMDARQYLCHIGLFDCHKDTGEASQSKPQLPKLEDGESHVNSRAVSDNRNKKGGNQNAEKQKSRTPKDINTKAKKKKMGSLRVLWMKK